MTSLLRVFSTVFPPIFENPAFFVPQACSKPQAGFGIKTIYGNGRILFAKQWRSVVKPPHSIYERNLTSKRLKHCKRLSLYALNYKIIYIFSIFDSLLVIMNANCWLVPRKRYLNCFPFNVQVCHCNSDYPENKNQCQFYFSRYFYYCRPRHNGKAIIARRIT